MADGMASRSSVCLEQGTERGLGSRDGKTGCTNLDSKRSKPRKERAVQSVAFALALIMVAGAGLGVLALVQKGPVHEKVTLAVPLFMTHSPILIESEAALTTANGVTGGNGTEGNPFVIQGWEINASAATEAGIAISNITSHLVIRNVNVHSGGSNQLGIALMYLTNCTVEFSQSSKNYAGIGVMMCDHIVIQNNTIVNNELEGILVFDSNYALVAHNIVVDSADPGAVHDNSTGVALFNSTGSSVVNNTMSYNGGAGLALEFCNETTVTGNSLENNHAGLTLIMSNGGQVDNNRISNNLFYGFFMMSCQNNTLFNNMIERSGTYGAFLIFCTNNTIYHNDFVSNSSSPQVYDDSIMNHWNWSYPIGGNFWNEHGGVDLYHGPDQNIPGSDGIWDTPYDITTIPAVNDRYPLVIPLIFGDEPTAFFTVSPASGPASTVFTFNASLCWDPDDLTEGLQVRWDFTSDGSWDTGWSTNKTIQHSYVQAGEYNVTMEVMDLAGHTTNATWHVEVDSLVIPEFTTLLVPICSMIAMFLVVGALGRRR